MTNFRFKSRNFFLAWLCLAGIFAGTGCHTNPFRDVVIGPGYEPSNAYRAAARVPLEIRRLAVLPLTAEVGAPSHAGLEMMEPVLRAQTVQTRKFEVVFITPEQLRHYTGKSHWLAGEKLPVHFFHTVREELGCDAVLFSHLTRFHAYPPLAIGWRMSLVDTHYLHTWWAADEVFDARDAGVANSARRFEKESVKKAPILADSRAILHSPRNFGHYTAAAVLELLPER